jgi:photosystem II stability/assembly factor-like uncharacterized protein
MSRGGQGFFAKTVFKLVAIVVLAASTVAGGWQPVGPFGGSVLSIAADPRHPGVLIAGARNGLLFRSKDGAKSWHRIYFVRPLSGPVQTLAIDPSNGDHYLAGISGEDPASMGLWESADGGLHWRQTLTGLAVESLALWRGDSAVVAVGTRHGVYLRSEGRDFVRISPSQNPELQDITAVAFDPADSKTLYAGTPHLPWKSTDGGESWHSIRGGMIDDSDVFSIAVDPTNSGRVFSSACSGIYLSETGGAEWKLLNGVPKTSRRTHIIAPDPERPHVLYAGTTSGLLKSADGGTTWRQLSSLQINSLAFSPGDSRTLYVAAERVGVLTTQDGGETLTPASQGILTRNAGGLAISGTSMWMSTAYEGEQGGLFKFEPASGWRQVATPAALGGGNVRALAAHGPSVYAATENRLYRWSELKWELVPAAMLTDVRALGFTGDTLLVGTSRGLFALFSGVSKWTAMDVDGHTRLPVLEIYALGASVAIRTEFGWYVSTDNGQLWKRWAMPASAGQVNEVALSCGGSALAATSRGLVRFSLVGSNPAAVRGIPDGTVSAVTFDPLKCGTAYAAQFGRAYVSRDDGESWTALDESGPQKGAIESLRVTSSHDLVALFRNEGVFRLDLPNDGLPSNYLPTK